MGLKDIVAKAKKTYTIDFHDTKLQFVELGYETANLAYKKGMALAKERVKDATEEDQSAYGSLYKIYFMLKECDSSITEDEFFGLSAEYLNELMISIDYFLSHEVHTESERIKKSIRDKLKSAALE